jgi:hypothetical protein
MIVLGKDEIVIPSKMKSAPVTDRTLEVDKFLPVFADRTDSYAYVDLLPHDGIRTIVVGSLRSPSAPPRPIAGLDRALGDMSEGNGFVPTFTFLGSTGKMAVRRDKSTIWVIPSEETGASERIELPEGVSAFVRAAWYVLRPAFAATEISNGYRFAWLGERGVVVVDASRVESSWKVETRELVANLQGFTRLNFSLDGQLLTLQQQTFGAGTKVRVWSFGKDRSELIAGRPNDELVLLACAASAIQQSAFFSSEEEMKLFGEEGIQPCLAIRARMGPDVASLSAAQK